MRTTLADLHELAVSTIQVPGYHISPDKIGELQAKAEDELSALTAGISSIGLIIATASANEDTGGVRSHEMESMGYLLQWAGQMVNDLMELNESAEYMKAEGETLQARLKASQATQEASHAEH